MFSSKMYSEPVLSVLKDNVFSSTQNGSDAIDLNLEKNDKKTGTKQGKVMTVTENNKGRTGWYMYMYKRTGRKQEQDKTQEH